LSDLDGLRGELAAGAPRALDVSNSARSRSSMRHHMGEPYAGQNQNGGKCKDDGIQKHAVPINIGAFRTFESREVRDRRVIWFGIVDGRLPSMQSARRTRSRPESNDPAAIVDRLRAIGTHDSICPYRLRARFPSRSRSALRAIQPRIILFRSDCLRLFSLVASNPPVAVQPYLHPVEIEIDDRRGVKRQQLA
jgi:hypothetical protein